MRKFIKLTNIYGNECLIPVDAIIDVIRQTSYSLICYKHGGDKDFLEVKETIDEIQSLLEQEI